MATINSDSDPDSNQDHVSDSSDTATITKDCVVEFNYEITDEQGAVLETTWGQSPSAILIGHRQMLPALEDAMLGHGVGDETRITLSPEQGYGERRQDWQQRVSKKYFAAAKKLKVGDVTQIQTEKGARTVTVVKVGSKVIDVDLNHPFAGQTLIFRLEFLSVRVATSEELAHGHAHGAHGHHH